LSRYSWNVRQITIMSPWYMTHMWGLLRWSQVTSQMLLEYCTGYSPLPVENAVFSLSSQCRSTCQQPLFRLMAQTHLAPASVSRVSSIRAVGNSPALWHRLVSCSLCRSVGPCSSFRQEQGIARCCLTLQ
jgi:hypothetical protein